MSLLSDYEARTAWKYEPIRGAFHTAESLILKVDPDGNYVPFAGSTAVFRPSSRCVRTVRLMQGALHHRLDGSGMLASPLPASTVHMTLHDLVSPEARRSGTAEEYGREIADSLRRAGLTGTRWARRSTPFRSGGRTRRSSSFIPRP